MELHTTYPASTLHGSTAYCNLRATAVYSKNHKKGKVILVTGRGGH
jgi:hypothetical protein